MVNNPQFNEVIATSYSGKVLSFTTEPVLQRATDDSYGRSVQTVNNENRLKYLHKEVEDLKKKVRLHMPMMLGCVSAYMHACVGIWMYRVCVCPSYLSVYP